MLKIIVLVVVVVVAAILLFAATRPDSFRLQRSTTIKASPEKIFALIDDFHRWQSWSPWEKLDPAMQRTYSGAAKGPGAVYEWTGNSKVGAGRMEITDSTPSSKVVIKLDFIKPVEGHNVAEFVLDQAGDATRVTWDMHGPARYLTKLMTTFVSMDRMVGGDFERGLANLKAVAEQ